MIAMDELDKGIRELQWSFYIRDTFNALQAELDNLKRRVAQLEEEGQSSGHTEV